MSLMFGRTRSRAEGQKKNVDACLCRSEGHRKKKEEPQNGSETSEISDFLLAFCVFSFT